MMVTGKTSGALRIDGTPSAAYSLTARALHWITAALVLTTIPLGVVIVNEWGGPLQDPLYDLHRSIGALLILVIIVRLGYRLTHPPLPLPDDIPPMQRVAARATHWALYGRVAAVLVVRMRRLVRSVDIWRPKLSLGTSVDGLII